MREGKEEAVVLRCAAAEFLRYGYETASLREITKGAGVTTGYIYFHYQNKNGLFKRLVHEAFCEIIQIIKDSLEGICTSPNKNPVYVQYYRQVIDQLFNFIIHHQNEVRLLTNSSEGTEYANFITKLLVMESEFADVLWPGQFIQIPHVRDLIQTLSYSLYTTIFKAASEDKKDIYYPNYLVQFHIGGLCKVFQIAEKWA